MIDDDIVKKIRLKEEEGLAMLIDTYGHYVSAIISNLSRGILRKEDVEELAADVFLSIWNHIEKFKPENPLKPYVAQAARNATISRIRKEKIPWISFDDDIMVISQEGNPHDMIIQKDQEEIINMAALELGYPDREIFVRFYYLGEKSTAIGQRLGINPSTVKTKLHRCRKHLKKLFEARGYHCEEGN